MSGKRILRYRLVCLLITLFMLGMGVHVDEVRMDSPLECMPQGNISFQRVNSVQEAVLYRENSAFSQLENLIVLRSSTRLTAGTRLVQWLLLCLLPVIHLLKYYHRDKSIFLYITCDNQYRRRTLEYIHHKDGKKA